MHEIRVCYDEDRAARLFPFPLLRSLRSRSRCWAVRASSRAERALWAGQPSAAAVSA